MPIKSPKNLDFWESPELHGGAFRKNFSEELKQLRLGNKLTIRAVSEMTGISRAEISKIENDQYETTRWRNMRTLAELYGVEILSSTAGPIGIVPGIQGGSDPISRYRSLDVKDKEVVNHIINALHSKSD